MCYATEQSILNSQWNAAELACRAAEQNSRPSVLFRPSLQIDGNKWCAFFGKDLQSGVAGFGNSPENAMLDFDKNWIKKL